MQVKISKNMNVRKKNKLSLKLFYLQWSMMKMKSSNKMLVCEKNDNVSYA